VFVTLTHFVKRSHKKNLSIITLPLFFNLINFDYLTFHDRKGKIIKKEGIILLLKCYKASFLLKKIIILLSLGKVICRNHAPLIGDKIYALIECIIRSKSKLTINETFLQNQATFSL